MQIKLYHEIGNVILIPQNDKLRKILFGSSSNVHPYTTLTTPLTSQ